MLTPHNFTGPRGLLIGSVTDPSLEFAQGLVLRYSKHYLPDNALIDIDQRGEQRLICAKNSPLAQLASTIATA